MGWRRQAARRAGDGASGVGWGVGGTHAFGGAPGSALAMLWLDLVEGEACMKKRYSIQLCRIEIQAEEFASAGWYLVDVQGAPSRQRESAAAHAGATAGARSCCAAAAHSSLGPRAAGSVRWHSHSQQQHEDAARQKLLSCRDALHTIRHIMAAPAERPKRCGLVITGNHEEQEGSMLAGSALGASSTARKQAAGACRVGSRVPCAAVLDGLEAYVAG